MNLLNRQQNQMQNTLMNGDAEYNKCGVYWQNIESKHKSHTVFQASNLNATNFKWEFSMELIKRRAKSAHLLKEIENTFGLGRNYIPQFKSKYHFVVFISISILILIPYSTCSKSKSESTCV